MLIIYLNKLNINKCWIKLKNAQLSLFQICHPLKIKCKTNNYRFALRLSYVVRWFKCLILFFTPSPQELKWIQYIYLSILHPPNKQGVANMKTETKLIIHPRINLNWLVMTRNRQRPGTTPVVTSLIGCNKEKKIRKRRVHRNSRR